MTINEKLESLSIYIDKIFPNGVNTEEERKLIFKRSDKDLDKLEINQIIKEHNKFISNL